MKIGELIEKIEKIASEISDGHYTILKFTSGYKAFFGTPDLDNGNEREKIAKLESFESIEEALVHLIENKTLFKS